VGRPTPRILAKELEPVFEAAGLTNLPNHEISCGSWWRRRLSLFLAVVLRAAVAAVAAESGEIDPWHVEPLLAYFGRRLRVRRPHPSAGLRPASGRPASTSPAGVLTLATNGTGTVAVLSTAATSGQTNSILDVTGYFQ
jgi:hypothetical protein